MVTQFEVIPAAKCSKRDVISALDIYCKSVDAGSMSDTNQIKDYIWNAKYHIHEPRKMFFHVLYGNNNSVEGFSEFAYLPENQVLVLDYLCTRQRNHVLFYVFYHMVLQGIEEELKKHGLIIRYIITEFSLTQAEGKLIDMDSNFFRHLLSNEDYKLLKYPYFQPPLLKHECAKEFNLAIKLIATGDGNPFVIEYPQYLAIVQELYFSHYLPWFKNDVAYKEIITSLLERIQSEILKAKDLVPISLVQCRLFEEGQCPKLSVESITFSRAKKARWKKIVLLTTWILLPLLVLAVCILPQFSKIAGIVCSFLTIIAGIISIASVNKDIFSRK